MKSWKYFTIPILGIAVLFVLGCTSLPAKPTTPEDYIKLGKEHETRGEYNMAILAYTHAIDIDSRHIEAYINRGKVYVHKENFTKAIEDFTRAVTIEPKCWDAYMQRGYAYMGMKDYDTAYNEFNNVFNNNPVYFGKVCIALGTLFAVVGNYDMAIAAFNLAISSEPDNYDFIMAFGHSLLSMGRIDQAIEQIEHAKSINPDISSCYMILSMAYALKGDNEIALNTIREGVANLSSTTEKSFLYYMFVPLHLGLSMDTDIFINEVKQFIDQGKHERPEIIYATLFMLYLVKNAEYSGLDNNGIPGFNNLAEASIDEAIKEFTTGINKYPKNKYLYFFRGQLYTSREDSVKARRDFDKAISIDQNFAGAYMYRASIAIEEKNYDRAIVDIKKVITLNPDFIVEAYNACGFVYYKKNDHTLAVEYLEKGLVADKDSIETNYLLGMVYEEQDNLEKAIEYYEKVLLLKPDLLKANKRIGEVYEKRGETEKAEIYFAIASGLDPDYKNAHDGFDLSVNIQIWQATL